MTEEKQQKFTAKVRRGLVWLHTVAAAELAKKKAEATGVRIEGFTASELADVESALTWIAQNKESQSTDPAAKSFSRTNAVVAHIKRRSAEGFRRRIECAAALPSEMRDSARIRRM